MYLPTTVKTGYLWYRNPKNKGTIKYRTRDDFPLFWGLWRWALANRTPPLSPFPKSLLTNPAPICPCSRLGTTSGLLHKIIMALPTWQVVNPSPDHYILLTTLILFALQTILMQPTAIRFAWVLSHCKRQEANSIFSHSLSAISSHRKKNPKTD